MQRSYSSASISFRNTFRKQKFEAFRTFVALPAFMVLKRKNHYVLYLLLPAQRSSLNVRPKNYEDNTISLLSCLEEIYNEPHNDKQREHSKLFQFLYTHIPMSQVVLFRASEIFRQQHLFCKKDVATVAFFLQKIETFWSNKVSAYVSFTCTLIFVSQFVSPYSHNRRRFKRMGFQTGANFHHCTSLFELLILLVCVSFTHAII